MQNTQNTRPSPPPLARGVQDKGSDRPIFVLKPRIIAGILPKFFVTLIAIVLFFIFFNPVVFLVVLLGRDFVFAGIILSFLIAVLLSFFLSYMNLRAREYRFFRDRVEFYEGFLNITRKLVRYERVTDITYTRSVWERLWGTGTIRINTAGSPYKEINISYVRNSEKVYNDVQNLIKEFSGGMTGTEGYARYR